MQQTSGTQIILMPRDNGHRFGKCDNYFCQRYSWLQPLYDGEGNVGGYVCTGECDDWSDGEGLGS